jgi:hypothetical protein
VPGGSLSPLPARREDEDEDEHEKRCDWGAENPSIRGITDDRINDPQSLDHSVDIVNAKD